MQDITTMKPTQLLVYSITGNDALGMLGAATTAAQQTIADAKSLMKGSEMLSALTENSMGPRTERINGIDRPIVPSEPTPLPGTPYSKWQIANKMAAIADTLSRETDSTKIAVLQAQLNTWSSMNGLNDTQLQIPTGEFTAMNKSLESNISNGQTQLQGIVQLGSTAVGNQSYANGLIQQSFG